MIQQGQEYHIIQGLPLLTQALEEEDISVATIPDDYDITTISDEGEPDQAPENDHIVNIDQFDGSVFEDEFPTSTLASLRFRLFRRNAS